MVPTCPLAQIQTKQLETPGTLQFRAVLPSLQMVINRQLSTLKERNIHCYSDIHKNTNNYSPSPSSCSLSNHAIVCHLQATGSTALGKLVVDRM